NVTRYATDFDNLRQTTTEAAGSGVERATTATFNAVGFVSQVTDALNHATTYVSDTLYRVATVLSSLHEQVARQTYDSVGNVLSYFNGYSSISNLFDGLDRQYKATDANSNSQSAKLDGFDNAKGNVDGRGIETNSVFNKLGQKTYDIDNSGNPT